MKSFSQGLGNCIDCHNKVLTKEETLDCIAKRVIWTPVTNLRGVELTPHFFRNMTGSHDFFHTDCTGIIITGIKVIKYDYEVCIYLLFR